VIEVMTYTTEHLCRNIDSYFVSDIWKYNCNFSPLCSLIFTPWFVFARPCQKFSLQYCISFGFAERQQALQPKQKPNICICLCSAFVLWHMHTVM